MAGRARDRWPDHVGGRHRRWACQGVTGDGEWARRRRGPPPGPGGRHWWSRLHRQPLVERLLGEGIAVMVVDDRSTGSPENVPTQVRLERLDISVADLDTDSGPGGPRLCSISQRRRTSCCHYETRSGTWPSTSRARTPGSRPMRARPTSATCALPSNTKSLPHHRRYCRGGAERPGATAITITRLAVARWTVAEGRAVRRHCLGSG